jgi:hypothetical protein
VAPTVWGDGVVDVQELEVLMSYWGWEFDLLPENWTSFRGAPNRIVCHNGLVLGVAKSSLRHRHTGGFRTSEISDVLRWGLEDAEQDMENLRQWRETEIDQEALVPWVNGTIRDAWGFKAATRAYHIACTGHDIEIVGKYKGRRPTTIDVKSVIHVPGCPEKAENASDLAQVLSWLAGRRRDVQERLERRQEIPRLMEAPLN